jgi:hypothetical protein
MVPARTWSAPREPGAVLRGGGGGLKNARDRGVSGGFRRGRVGVGRARTGARGAARASCGRAGGPDSLGGCEILRWGFDARAVRRATFRQSHVAIGGGRRARATSARGDGGDGDAPADDGAERGRGGVRGEAVNGEHVDGETSAATGARGVSPAPTAWQPLSETSERATSCCAGGWPSPSAHESRARRKKPSDEDLFSRIFRVAGNREPGTGNRQFLVYFTNRVDDRESFSRGASTRTHITPPRLTLRRLPPRRPRGRSSRASRRRRRAVHLREIPGGERFPPLARRRLE